MTGEIENQIANAAALTDVFGHWPSFHDARLLAFRPELGGADGLDDALDLDLTEPAARRDERGRFPETRARITLHLADALPSPHPDPLQPGATGDLSIARTDGAGQPDVLRLAFGSRRWTVRWTVRWTSSYGDDISFWCDAVAVVRVERLSRAR